MIYIYLSLSWQSFDQYIRLVDQIISDEKLGIEETKYGYEDIIRQAKLSLINLRDIYKSLQINQEYAEDVVYCIGKLHRFIKDYQKTIITDLSEAYQTLQYG